MKSKEEKPDVNLDAKPENPQNKVDQKIKKTPPRKKKTKRLVKNKISNQPGNSTSAKYPRHSLEKVLRIPRSILDQNAGQQCSEREAASFVGVSFNGTFRGEISSALKYGLLLRPSAGQVSLTDRARKILRPQKPDDEIIGLREAVLDAPDINEVYRHYRGENLPDQTFFRNALVDKFKIPEDKTLEFESIFIETLIFAQLLEEHNDKKRILDIKPESDSGSSDIRLRKLGKEITIKSTDTCFVMMPFASPIGDYYSLLFEPAIKKAGLIPIRADTDIFGTGKIIDQIWRGINDAKVLVAELTGRNPNVFYELGLSHALDKPVVLVSSNEDDVPFDLQHIRVIYYDVRDPFWGNKLIEKIAENILSAIKNPEEAIFKTAIQAKGGK